MSIHTPEPWEPYGELNIRNSFGEPVAACGPQRAKSKSADGHAENMANVKRIVQCVNACSGLDMSKVSAGAVKELVEAAKTIRALLEKRIPGLKQAANTAAFHRQAEYDSKLRREEIEYRDTLNAFDTIISTLAPFVKKEYP